MELHQLRYFVAVAQLENFTRAAQKCFVAQPSLSQQIIKLERECGGPLFDRSGRKVRLTDRGRTLFDRAIEILAAVEGAKRALTEDSDAGQITVGAIPTIAPYLLPPLLKRFLRDYPKTEVTVSENLTEYTIQACLEGDVDVGVLALPISEDQLAIEPLLTEELLLAMAAGHPLAARRHARCLARAVCAVKRDSLPGAAGGQLLQGAIVPTRDQLPQCPAPDCAGTRGGGEWSVAHPANGGERRPLAAHKIPLAHRREADPHDRDDLAEEPVPRACGRAIYRRAARLCGKRSPQTSPRRRV
jgi:DNA-binding transcriptional LysR family regulator